MINWILVFSYFLQDINLVPVIPYTLVPFMFITLLGLLYLVLKIKLRVGRILIFCGFGWFGYYFIHLIFALFISPNFFVLRELVWYFIYVLGSFFWVWWIRKTGIIKVLSYLINIMTFLNIVLIINSILQIFVGIGFSYFSKSIYHVATLPRLSGFASEPAYWVSLMILPYSYIMFKDGYWTKKIINTIAIILTFSSFGYFIVMVLWLVWFLKNVYDKYINNKYSVKILVLVEGIILVGIMGFISYRLRGIGGKNLITIVFNKILEFNTPSDYSRIQRIIWKNIAISMFNELILLRKIWGAGISFYQNNLENYVVKLGLDSDFTQTFQILSSDDSGSLYYRLFLETGFIGLVLFVMHNLIVIFRILKANHNRINFLVFSVFFFMVYFYLTGNVWIYAYWFMIYLSIVYVSDNKFNKNLDEKKE